MATRSKALDLLWLVVVVVGGEPIRVGGSVLGGSVSGMRCGDYGERMVSGCDSGLVAPRSTRMWSMVPAQLVRSRGGHGGASRKVGRKEREEWTNVVERDRAYCDTVVFSTIQALSTSQNETGARCANTTWVVCLHDTHGQLLRTLALASRFLRNL